MLHVIQEFVLSFKRASRLCEFLKVLHAFHDIVNVIQLQTGEMKIYYRKGFHNQKEKTYNMTSCFKLSMSFGNSWLNALELKFLFKYVIIMQDVFSIKV